MTDKTLLIVGNDRVSAKALSELRKSHNILVAIDNSTNVSRVLRLIWRGSLSLGLVLKMFVCEKRRKSLFTSILTESITSNTDVIRLLKKQAPSRVILFRAGLIINKDVLSVGVPVMNIHCAKIPEYGGIGAINRAMRDQSYLQCATLHQVTKNIDSGDIYDTEPYVLDPKLGYCANEDRAYEAGINLLKRILKI